MAGGIDDDFADGADRAVMTLDEYLDAAMRRRWAWGDMDCVQFAGGWVKARTGKDLLAGIAYHDDAGARRILREGGGLLALVTERMAAHGFAPTDAPDDGDVAFVPLDTRSAFHIAGGAMAIGRGPWWVFKDLRGLASRHVNGARAWRIV